MDNKSSEGECHSPLHLGWHCRAIFLSILSINNTIKKDKYRCTNPNLINAQKYLYTAINLIPQTRVNIQNTAVLIPIFPLVLTSQLTSP